MDLKIGLHEVYAPPPGITAVANICFVHGLFGGPWKSFAVKKGHANPKSMAQSNADIQDSKYIFWPRDLLPRAVHNVRVLTFGYDADVSNFMAAAGLNSLYQHARNLLNAISDLLDETPETLPIIFVAHSLGGLVVKQALNQSATTTDPRRKRALENVRGIVFLGTPHHGSTAASYGRTFFRLGQLFAFQSANTKLLAVLERNSDQLDQLSTEFCETLEKSKMLQMWSFSEEREVRIGPVGMQIVPADSAKINHIRENWGSISGDHRRIAKYRSTSDDGFVKVSSVLKGWTRDLMGSTRGRIQLSTSHKECLESLNDPVARTRVQAVEQISRTNRGSFEWLYTQQVPFVQWLRDDGDLYGPLFWITGRPGSGKSTIMRFALENPQTMQLLPESVGGPMAYFFHLRGKSTVQKSLKGMLKELLYQLLRQFPHFYDRIGSIYKQKVMAEDKVEWDKDSLVECFMQIPYLKSNLPARRDRVVLFVDALDENENQRENETMVQLLKTLSKEYEEVSKESRTPLLKICLASRTWPLFNRELGHDIRIPSFAIHNFTTHDIRSYASSLLAEPLRNYSFPPAYHDGVLQLADEIMERSNGVFIWVRVVVDNSHRHITDGTPIEALRIKIREFPEELKDLYEYTVRRIPEDYCMETQVLFKVLFSSRTALTLDELYVVTQICVGQRPDDNFEASEQTVAWLASRSGGLMEKITICSSSDTESDEDPVMISSSVQFIHQTVQDYVRTGIKGIPTPSRPVLENSHVPQTFQAPGYQLLVLACLDSFPPHPCVRRIAEDIFAYMRESEQSLDDEKPDSMDPANPSFFRLPTWNSDATTFHFPCDFHELRYGVELQSFDILLYYLSALQRQVVVKLVADVYGRELSEVYTPETTGHLPQGSKDAARNWAYLSPGIAKPISPAKARLARAVRLIMAINRCNRRVLSCLVIITQDLYYTPIADGWLTYRDWGLTLLMAALGKRVAKDRTDRSRMLRKFLALSPSRPTLIGQYIPTIGVNMVSFDPIVVQPYEKTIWWRDSSILGVVATSMPNQEVPEDMLLHMTEIVLASKKCGGGDNIVRISTSHVRGMGKSELIEMPLILFCAKFKGLKCKAWIQRFLQHGTTLNQAELDVFNAKLYSQLGFSYRDDEKKINDVASGIISSGSIFTILGGRNRI